MTDALQLRDNAKFELEQIRDLESGVAYLNKMTAIEHWVKAERKDADLQNMVAEQKLRTQRILGNLLAGEIKVGNPQLSSPSIIGKLDDYGITPNQSSAFQQIADIPEQTFEEYIKEKKQAVNNAVAELTTTGAVRLAKSLKQTKIEDHGNDYEDEVSELIRRINSLPPIYRLKVKQGIRRA